MNTVLVDIKESDLVNFTLLNKYSLGGFNEDGHKKLFEEYPFILYGKRMMGDHVITIQIPLENYILFLEYNLVK